MTDKETIDIVEHRNLGLARLLGYCQLTNTYRVKWMGIELNWPAADCYRAI